jgi:hypothetical protein
MRRKCGGFSIKCIRGQAGRVSQLTRNRTRIKTNYTNHSYYDKEVCLTGAGFLAQFVIIRVIRAVALTILMCYEACSILLYGIKVTSWFNMSISLNKISYRMVSVSSLSCNSIYLI